MVGTIGASLGAGYEMAGKVCVGMFVCVDVHEHVAVLDSM